MAYCAIKPFGYDKVQPLALSAASIALCAVVYERVGYIVATAGESGSTSECARRIIDGFAGGTLALVAVHIARLEGRRQPAYLPCGSVRVEVSVRPVAVIERFCR